VPARAAPSSDGKIRVLEVKQSPSKVADPATQKPRTLFQRPVAFFSQSIHQ
jgi:hypothetical protein